MLDEANGQSLKRESASISSSLAGLTRSIGPYGLLAPVLAVGVIALVGYTLLHLILNTFVDGSSGASIAPFKELVNDPALPHVIIQTAILLLAGGGLALVIGSTFAWLNERTDAGFGTLGRLLPIIPLMMPGVAVSVGWEFLANSRAGVLNSLIQALLRPLGWNGSTGPLNIESWPGLIFMYAMALVPFSYIIMRSAFTSLDPALEESSRVSGAGLGRTLRRVVIPAVSPALRAAAMIVLIFGLSDYSIPVVIGPGAKVTTVSVYIVDLATAYPTRTDEAAALGLLAALLVGLLWTFQRRAVGHNRYAVMSGRQASGSVVKLGRWRIVARLAMILYVLISTVLPALGLLLVALEPYWTSSIQWAHLGLGNYTSIFSGTSDTLKAIGDSAQLGLEVATFGVMAALLVTVYTRESRRLRIGRIVDSLTKLPAGIPAVVMGLAFISAFGGAPFFLYGGLVILILAYFVMFLPHATVAIGSAYDQIGEPLREASFVSGAARGRTLWRVTLPLVRPGLVAAWAMLFVLGMGELTASVLLSSSDTPVVGATFLEIWENGTYGQLAAMGTIVTAISMCVIFTAALTSTLQKERFGSNYA